MIERAAKPFGLLVLMLTAYPVQAQPRLPMTFGDIEITLQGVPQGSGLHGYTEYAFRVRNKSTERPHIVGLSIPADRFRNFGDSIRDLRRSMQVGANETARLSLLQPDHPPLDGANVAVFIDGQQQESNIQLKPNESNFGRRPYRGAYYSYSPSPGTDSPLVLIGDRVGSLPVQPTGFGMAGSGSIMMGGSAGGAGSPMILPPARPMPPPGGPKPTSTPHEKLNLLREKAVPGWGTTAEMLMAWEIGSVVVVLDKSGLPPNSHQPVNAEPVETWSNNWLSYTRYDGVLVTADELKAMPAGVRTALWQYVETGGFLLVIGPADLHGLSAVTETTTDAAGWKTVHAGFGQCLVAPNNDYKKWDIEHYDRLNKLWSSVAGAWSSGQRSTSLAHRDVPVVEELGIPAKGLFVLMFLFTLGIGPINLWMLSRFKRRIWLLWTTPVISLATCLAVFGYMLISEGWQGHLRIDTLTLLDETTHRATTMGWTGVYSPLTPSEGLHFSYETEVIPQRFFEGDRRGSRSCTIDWSQDQHFVSGWVEARVPAFFKVRKSEMRRERVTLHREANGSWSMVNGLGAAIRRFWYADDKEQMYTAENVAEGARMPLKLSEQESQAPTLGTWNLSSISGWSARVKDIAAHPQRYLRPGSYLAEVDDSPFLEAALRTAKKRKTYALIVGFRQHDE